MKYLSFAKKIVVCVLLVLGGYAVWRISVFVLGGSWTAWGLGKVISLVWTMLKFVFSATVLSLLPPIAVYLLLVGMLKNPVLRVASGIGCAYAFWVLGGGAAIFTWGSFYTPIDTVLKMLRLSLQIYFLVILVMPHELMSILGTVATVIGSIVIYFFPDAPGALDDIAAVCTLISMVFVYLNTLASFIKHYAEVVLDFIVSKAKILLPNNEEEDYEEEEEEED